VSVDNPHGRHRRPNDRNGDPGQPGSRLREPPRQPDNRHERPQWPDSRYGDGEQPWHPGNGYEEQQQRPDDKYKQPQRPSLRRFYREPAETVLDMLPRRFYREPAETVLDMLPGRAGWKIFRSYGPFLVLLPALVAYDRLWFAQLLLVLLLLVFPGVLLLRTLRVSGEAVAASPVYVPAASLAVLTASGLAVDLIGPLVRVHEPLRAIPLICGLELTCVALTFVATRSPADAAVPWRRLNYPLRGAWPLIIPLIAAVGALRLNNGHSSAVAVLAVCLSVAAFAWALIRAHRMGTAQLITTVYAVSLALMWGYSLRGTLVYGFDISTEYGILHQTVLSGVWHSSHPGDAYGALPSVTVLPAELHFLTGISDLMILKLVYPAITALFPVGIFSFSRRFLRPRWGFAAAAFVVMQSAFGQELPALARQEIALIFFIAMIAAMFDSTLGRRPRWTLTAMFGVGMAISHYSTAYFAIGMLAMLLLVEWLVSLRRDVPRLVGAFAVALIAATVSAALWYGPITKSSSNLSQFISSAKEAGPELFSGGSSLLTGASTDTPMSAAAYQSTVSTYYKQYRAFVVPFPDASEPQYALKAASSPPTPAERVPAVHSLINLGDLVLTELADLVAACAAIYIALRRKTPPAVRLIFLFGIGTLLELGILRASPTLSGSYNQPRALIQGFTVLGIPLMWPLQHFSTRLRRHGKMVITVGVLALGAFFIDNSGLMGSLLGGGTATNFANSGEDYERYFVTAQELAAAQWLSLQIRNEQLVYADSYGELRLAAVGVKYEGLLNDITPATLNQSAWIYATTANVADGHARVYFNNKEVTYEFPEGFLNSHYGVMYSDGSSEVFGE
jgi:uncharacterized membrane protein